MPLPREEYVEQAYFFRTLRERMQQSMSTQELLGRHQAGDPRHNAVALALDFMASDLASRAASPRRWPSSPTTSRHFRPTWWPRPKRPRAASISAWGWKSWNARPSFAARGASPQGLFLYQFETLCRNRLGYDRGLEAMAGDNVYDANWREWILSVRHQVGLIDLGDMLYVRSEHYRKTRAQTAPEKPVLFGEKEGRIALANRHKDPLYLFSALARHLGYPDSTTTNARRHQPHAHPYHAAQAGTSGATHEAFGRRSARRDQPGEVLPPRTGKEKP